MSIDNRRSCIQPQNLRLQFDSLAQNRNQLMQDCLDEEEKLPSFEELTEMFNKENADNVALSQGKSSSVSKTRTVLQSRRTLGQKATVATPTRPPLVKTKKLKQIKTVAQDRHSELIKEIMKEVKESSSLLFNSTSGQPTSTVLAGPAGKKKAQSMTPLEAARLMCRRKEAQQQQMLQNQLSAHTTASTQERPRALLSRSNSLDLADLWAGKHNIILLLSPLLIVLMHHSAQSW